MRAEDYDVIVVGARCAGATLAAFLARAGAHVLLVDKDALPSEYVVSTHCISPAGIDVLDAVGVGDAVRAVTPPARVIRLHAEGTILDARLPEGRAGYCPRRERLDGLLQQAAVDSGAELRDRSKVTSLIRQGDRVRGVRLLEGGRERTFTAGLVVGADGRHSTVARLVEAQEYLGYDAQRAAHWGYWDAPTFWHADAAYRFDMYFTHFGGETGVVFPTDNNQLLIGSWPSADRTAPWRANPERTLCTVLASEPVIGPLIRGSRPLGKVRGTLKERFYFRTGAGNGWALIGDAGHHKDFVIGDGITEALLQAQSLAAAIAAGSDAALVRWWRARDVAALPVYHFAKEAGAPGPLPELLRVFFARLVAHPTLTARIIESVDRRQLPVDITLAWYVARWTLAAVMRGRPQVLADLLATAERAAGTYRELRMRRRLLAIADARAAHGELRTWPPPGGC